MTKTLHINIVFLFLLIIGCTSLQYNAKSRIATKSDFIKELYITKSELEKGQKKDISRFMKVGYKQHPILKDKDIRAIPIYAIFGVKRLEEYKLKPVKDSLLYYLNPNKLELYQVAFYKGNDFIGIAEPAYANYNTQLIGKGIKNDWIDSIIKKEKPDLIFYIVNSSYPVFILKDSKLYCFTSDISSKNNIQKEKYTIDEYIKEYLNEEELYWLLTNTQKMAPLIYTK